MGVRFTSGASVNTLHSNPVSPYLTGSQYGPSTILRQHLFLIELYIENFVPCVAHQFLKALPRDLCFVENTNVALLRDKHVGSDAVMYKVPAESFNMIKSALLRLRGNLDECFWTRGVRLAHISCSSKKILRTIQTVMCKSGLWRRSFKF